MAWKTKTAGGESAWLRCVVLEKTRRQGGESEHSKRDAFQEKKVKSENKGLISEDRSNTATLPLTIPRSLFKSSAKDLALTMFLV